MADIPRETAGMGHWAIATSGFQHGEVTSMGTGAKRLRVRMQHLSVAVPSRAAPKAVLLDLKGLGRTGTNND